MHKRPLALFRGGGGAGAALSSGLSWCYFAFLNKNQTTVAFLFIAFFVVRRLFYVYFFTVGRPQ